ncbi:ABC transporter substrate-binding protein [Rhodobacteraceae bacterium WD3A24]|nr:ABC transporter substrate-binding protein [Rhodobacteraceae bacterium WD3A24]
MSGRGGLPSSDALWRRVVHVLAAPARRCRRGLRRGYLGEGEGRPPRPGRRCGWRAAAGLVAALASAQPAAPAGAPGRVVSINLCTDQLAMMLAAPGQLVSVSSMARDPRMSAMVAEAAEHHVNHGGAEAVFRLDPDLVLAGRHTTRATVRLLRRLGVPVEEFAPARDFDDVRANIARVGAALGREGAAEALVAEFDARLAALRAEAGRAPEAALYYANSFTAGAESLAGHILAAAGLSNIAPQGGVLPLERLIMRAPELVVRGARYPGGSRAEEVLAHPALRALLAGRPAAPLADADWVCGTPHLLRAVGRLRDARETLE